MTITTLGLRRVLGGGLLIPNPTHSANFLSSTTLPSGLAFTRASTARYTASGGLLALAASDAPRFDYDPVTLQARGLLMETAATNLMTYSEALDDASWVKTAASVTANAVAAPDGSTTADKFTESATTAEHMINKAVTIASGDTITVSAYIKAAGRTKCYFLVDAGAPYATISFDLAAKTATLNYRAQSGTAVVASAGSVQNAGNGFVRVTATFATAGVTAIYISLRLIDSGNAFSYAGDGTSGVYAWGMQAEKGAFATSYIATASATATRAADLCSGLTSGLSWWNASEGTILIDSDIAAVSPGGARLWTADDGTASNVMAAMLQTGGTYDTLVTAGSVSQAAITSPARGAVTQANVISAYKVNAFAHRIDVLNGGIVQTDTSGTIPTVTRFRLGGSEGNLLQPNGVIRRIQYWNKALTGQQIRSLK